MRTFQKTEDTGDFVVAPEGTTAAVLICLAFLGRHESTWNGETKLREMVGLAWELSEPGPDGRALSVTETLSASFHEKSKLFSRILALTGGREPPRGFDLAGLLGRGAIVTVGHAQKGERTYANVAAVGPLPRGLAAPVPSVRPVFFDIETPDPAAYAAMPARFRKLADTAIGTTPAAPAAPWSRSPGGQAYAPPAAAGGQWAASHATQATAGWSPPAPPPPRQPGPPPAPPAAVPFDDDIPF